MLDIFAVLSLTFMVTANAQAVPAASISDCIYVTGLSRAACSNASIATKAAKIRQYAIALLPPPAPPGAASGPQQPRDVLLPPPPPGIAKGPRQPSEQQRDVELNEEDRWRVSLRECGGPEQIACLDAKLERRIEELSVRVGGKKPSSR